MYNMFDEKESGLMAMIYYKNGYALKADEVWKNMTYDEGSFILKDAFGGENVQLVTGKNIRSIKPENIITTMNYDLATLAKGDSAQFIYVPDMYNMFDEKESGMMAMINYKKGYAFKTGKVWEDMTKDEGDYVTDPCSMAMRCRSFTRARSRPSSPRTSRHSSTMTVPN